jgi:ABC-type maltose transport system permease subunit
MGYFKTIPSELEECALIDGASRWQILTQIVLAGSPWTDLRVHLLLHLVLERVHLRAYVYLLDSAQDGARRDC